MNEAAAVYLGVGADITDLESKMGKGNDVMDRFGGHVQKAEKGGDSFFGGLLGGAAKIGMALTPIGMVGGLVGDLGGKLFDAAKAADEEQVGMNRLYTTMQNSVKGWDGNTDAVEAYITKQQDLAFADDQLRDSLNFLVGQTGDLGEAQKLQATAMDLARSKNIDLQTATKLVGKVDMDNINVLKKLGIQVDDNMTKEQALSAIRAQTAGQAEAYAHTTAGAMERFQTDIGNVVESVGHTILPKLTDALGHVADFVGSPEFQDTLNNAIAFIGQGFDFLGGLFDKYGPTIMGVLTGIWNAAQPLVGVFQNFFADIQAGEDPLQAFGDMLSNLGPVIMDLGGKVFQAVSDALPGIMAKLGEWGQAFFDWIGPQIPVILGKLGELAGTIGAWLWNTGLPWLIQHLAEWGKAFIDWVGPQIPPLLGKLGELLMNIGGWLLNTGLPTLIQKLGEWGGAFLGWVQRDVLPFIGQKLGEFGQAIWNWLTGGGAADLIANLATWAGNFISWMDRDVLPFIGGKLGEFAQAIWTWLTTDAVPNAIEGMKQMGAAFLDWVQKDVLPFLGQKLGEIWTAITNWIGTTASNILTAVGDIGKNLVQGIWNGISGAWNGFMDFLHGLVMQIPEPIRNFLGIHSPSTLFGEIGANIILGLQGGIDGQKEGPKAALQNAMTYMMEGISDFLNKRGDEDKSVVVKWRAAFNDIFQFMTHAWIPQISDRFKGTFTAWLDWEGSFLQSFTQAWVDAMSNLPGPPMPGEGGGGGGGSAPPIGGSGGSGGTAGGGHGAGIMVVHIHMPDGTTQTHTIFGTREASVDLRTDQRMHGTLPSVVQGALSG